MEMTPRILRAAPPGRQQVGSPAYLEQTPFMLPNLVGDPVLSPRG